VENILLEALKTSSIDFNIDSDEKYQYELIANGEEKIVTRLRKYFEDCDEFIISVAFITMGGISLFLEELKNFDSDLLKDYNEFKNSDYNRLTLDETARFTKVGNDIEIELYDDISYEELCENLKNEGFSLPNLDEWEYLCGGGCRTLFPWGDDLDYNMNLLYFSKEDNDKYDLEEPNFFGLSIAYDPYKMEIIEADELIFKGGDGGCNVCGGFGEFLGYLSCSPYYTQEHMNSINIVDDSIVNEYDDELDGDFNFYRRILRIEE